MAAYCEAAGPYRKTRAALLRRLGYEEAQEWHVNAIDDHWWRTCSGAVARPGPLLTRNSRGTARAGGPQLWANLEACGWPGRGNTGYPAGTTLTNTSGRVITTDNAVISSERIAGQLVVRAKNVTVENSAISFDGGGSGGSGVI